jgi:hypothetical protein
MRLHAIAETAVGARSGGRPARGKYERAVVRGIWRRSRPSARGAAARTGALGCIYSSSDTAHNKWLPAAANPGRIGAAGGCESRESGLQAARNPGPSGGTAPPLLVEGNWASELGRGSHGGPLGRIREVQAGAAAATGLR